MNRLVLTEGNRRTLSLKLSISLIFNAVQINQIFIKVCVVVNTDFQIVVLPEQLFLFDYEKMHFLEYSLQHGSEIGNDKR